jgi:hypothetical protein
MCLPDSASHPAHEVARDRAPHVQPQLLNKGGLIGPALDEVREVTRIRGIRLPGTRTAGGEEVGGWVGGGGGGCL